MFAPTTGTPPGEALGDDERCAVPPERGDHGRIEARQDRGQLGVRERAGELDDSALVERREPLGERPWDLAVDADAQVAVDELRRLDEQLRPLVGIGRADEADRQRDRCPVRAGGRARRPPRSPASSGIAWWTTSIISAGKPSPTSVRRMASDTARMRSTRSENRSRSSLRRSA